jgi:hypothetical protein
MNKLKTIKDINEETYDIDGNMIFISIKDELIKSCIKDIKYYEKLKLPQWIPEETREYAKGMVIDYIKTKFNIE